MNNIIRIHTETQEQYDVVTTHYVNALYKNYWPNYKEEMVVNVENRACMSYGNTPFYAKRGEKVYSFAEWIQLTNPKKESNMKYVVEVNSQQESDAVYKQNGKSPVKRTDYPQHITSIGTWNEANIFHHRPENIKTYGPLLSFAQFAAMFDINLKPNRTLKLTDDYSAVVNYETKIVQVGCQSIPFTKVEELAELIKE